MTAAMKVLRLDPGQLGMVLHHAAIADHAQRGARMLDHTGEIGFREMRGIVPGSVWHRKRHASKRTLKELADWNLT
jgi:hypothetical protein